MLRQCSLHMIEAVSFPLYNETKEGGCDMKTIKTLKFKLYSSKKNKHLDGAVNVAASVWNYCIAMHRRYYRMYGKGLSANRLKKHITKLKRRRKYAFWNELGSQAIQDVVERVDRSYKAFFEHHKQKRRGRKPPPGFKKHSRYSSFTLKQAQGRALLRGAGCGRKGVFPVPYVQRGHGGLDGALPAGCERDLARPAELTGS